MVTSRPPTAVGGWPPRVSRRVPPCVPAKAACLSDGLALNRTAAPAFTSTFSPVRGFSAVRLGVSRTVKAPKSGSEKRPVSTISARIAATTSPASRPAALAGMSAARAMTSVRNLLDMRRSLARAPSTTAGAGEESRPVPSTTAVARRGVAAHPPLPAARPRPLARTAVRGTAGAGTGILRPRQCSAT